MFWYLGNQKIYIDPKKLTRVSFNRVVYKGMTYSKSQITKEGLQQKHYKVHAVIFNEYIAEEVSGIGKRKVTSEAWCEEIIKE